MKERLERRNEAGTSLPSSVAVTVMEIAAEEEEEEEAVLVGEQRVKEALDSASK